VPLHHEAGEHGTATAALVVEAHGDGDPVVAVDQGDRVPSAIGFSSVK
jgi:hypothetical protein